MDSFSEAVAWLHQRGFNGDGVFIGHLDTGIDETHPALTGRVADFRHFGIRGIAEESLPVFDSGWHGTHTAGLMVGQLHNGQSVGIAPKASLYSGAVIEQGNVIARILRGLDWLLDTDVRVVNLSLGLFSKNPVIRSLIRSMAANDIIIVAPIGNRGAGQASHPGIYAECLSVGATQKDGRVAPFSGSANDAATIDCIKPDVLAPGVAVISCVPGGGFAPRNGTSAASATVARICALLRGAFPKLSASAVQQALIESCELRHVDQRHRSIAGVVNPIRAYNQLAEDRDILAEKAGHFSNATYKQSSPDCYIDPRLNKLFASTPEDSLCDAVFEFDSWHSLDYFREEFRRGIDPVHDKERLKVLKHCPIVICQGSRRLLVEVSRRPWVRAASACDIDRFI